MSTLLFERFNSAIKQKQLFPNTGIRKAILLTNYVILIKKWIEANKSKTILTVSAQWKQIFNEFLDYFKTESQVLKDETLSKEAKILRSLLL